MRNEEVKESKMGGKEDRREVKPQNKREGDGKRSREVRENQYMRGLKVT
jgi:hypothetical protein